MWERERNQYQRSSGEGLQQMEVRLRDEIVAIGRELQQREECYREETAKVVGQIERIRQVQKECHYLVGDLTRRIEALEAFLGR